MRTKYINTPQKDNPVLLDKVIQGMQASLLKNLPWLDHAFGRAYRLVRHDADSNKFVYPAAYNGNGEYLSLLPDDQFGNFAWFDIYDPQKVEYATPLLPTFTFSGAIVFWYNLRSIYADATNLYTEEVKNEILGIISTPGAFESGGRLEINEINENFENIYKGYSIEKIYNEYMYSGQDIQGMDKQFFMYPYAGLRLEFTLTVRETCYKR